MDVLSPARTCDPWAVRSAKNCDPTGQETSLNPVQLGILRIITTEGGAGLETLASRLQSRPADLEREIAALRHMERLRATLRDGRKVFIPW